MEDKQDWQDLLISDRDITLDAAGMPYTVVNKPSITQDICHMILESGVLVELIGERSESVWANHINRLETMVEDDVRIVPGTVVIEREHSEKLWIFADSMVGELELDISLGVVNPTPEWQSDPIISLHLLVHNHWPGYWRDMPS